MTESERKQINEELVKYVGFTYKKCTPLEMIPDGWYYPNDTFCPILPDFTGSMDACIRWIIPELKKLGCEVISFYYEFEAIACDLTPIGKCNSTIEEHGTTEAEAFSIAALKYFREVKHA